MTAGNDQCRLSNFQAIAKVGRPHLTKISVVYSTRTMWEVQARRLLSDVHKPRLMQHVHARCQISDMHRK